MPLRRMVFCRRNKGPFVPPVIGEIPVTFGDNRARNQPIKSTVGCPICWWRVLVNLNLRPGGGLSVLIAVGYNVQHRKQ